MKLYAICYISKKSADCNEQTIEKIIETASKNNAQKMVSGVLIEYKDNFIQYLEGEPIVLHELFEKIKKDSRHEQVQLLKFTDIENRLFSSWNMTYKTLKNNKLNDKSTLPKHSEKLDSIIENKEFWNGIETIEYLLNLSKD